VVEERRLERLLREVGRPIGELDPALADPTSDRPLDAEATGILDRSTDDHLRSRALGRHVVCRQERVGAMQPDPLGRRADVVQPARGQEAAAPCGPPVRRVGTALARRRDPRDRHASKPGGSQVQPTAGVNAELDSCQHMGIDRRPLRCQSDLIEVAEPVARDHRGSSTSKSTLIP
jgi:hypothetical protein